jgi:phosphoenolpyruvate carboxykinase (GTP)
MIKRADGEVGAVETPIGNLPAEDDLDLKGVELSDEARAKLFGFDAKGWKAEFASIGEYLDEYGPRMPEALKVEQRRIAGAL